MATSEAISNTLAVALDTRGGNITLIHPYGAMAAWQPFHSMARENPVVRSVRGREREACLRRAAVRARRSHPPFGRIHLRSADDIAAATAGASCRRTEENSCSEIVVQQQRSRESGYIKLHAPAQRGRVHRRVPRRVSLSSRTSPYRASGHSSEVT